MSHPKSYSSRQSGEDKTASQIACLLCISALLGALSNLASVMYEPDLVLGGH